MMIPFTHRRQLVRREEEGQEVEPDGDEQHEDEGEGEGDGLELLHQPQHHQQRQLDAGEQVQLPRAHLGGCCVRERV